jgi:hypothetical protein
VAGMTGACVARLSADRTLVLCGHQYPTGHYCATERNEPTVLVSVDEVSDIRAGVEQPPHRFLNFDSDWEDDGGGVIARTATAWRRKQHGNAPTRRGWAPNIAGGRVKPRKSFVLSTLVKCPQCFWLNTLNPVVLDVVELPRKT